MPVHGGLPPRALLDALPAAIYTTDAEGRITFYNAAAAEFWGREPVIGEDRWCGSWRLYLQDGTPLRHQDCPMGVALREDRIVRNDEVVAERPDGTRVAFMAYPTPLHDAQGRLVGAINMLIDLTEAKRREVELVQAHKMEALGRLTGGVAHDFNNLLTVVIGNADLLIESLAEETPERQTVSTIKRAAQKGARLIHRLLAFARRQPLQPRQLDLCEVVRGISDLLRGTLGDGVELRLSLQEAYVRVDPEQLELVILNLAANARDAMGGAGGLVEITVASDEASSWIALRDNGCGMSTEVLAKASEPFFSTKRVGHGTGLGLSMAQGFAAQSGGCLELRSASGAGTTAELRFPRSTRRTERAAA